MRKFTLYQAARFTKISRYKLEQAIEEGLLECVEGKGNVKCFIPENSLTEFVENYGEQYRRFTYPDEAKQPYVSDEINQYISKEFHDQIIKEKNRVIELLEFQNQQLSHGNNSLTKLNAETSFHELKSIALSAINELPESKANVKKKLTSDLGSI